jgi:hypothetical protein
MRGSASEAQRGIPTYESDFVRLLRTQDCSMPNRSSKKLLAAINEVAASIVAEAR